jgi:hypothetical protein
MIRTTTTTTTTTLFRDCSRSDTNQQTHKQGRSFCRKIHLKEEEEEEKENHGRGHGCVGSKMF